jgi:hypothetical protein
MVETSKESEKCETSVKEDVDAMSGKIKRNKPPPRQVFTASHVVTRWNGFHQVYREKLLKYYINCLSFLCKEDSKIYINVQPSYYATYVFLPTTMNHQST